MHTFNEYQRAYLRSLGHGTVYIHGGHLRSQAIWNSIYTEGIYAAQAITVYTWRAFTQPRPAQYIHGGHLRGQAMVQYIHGGHLRSQGHGTVYARRAFTQPKPW